jgi:hypothetical protein
MARNTLENNVHDAVGEHKRGQNEPWGTVVVSVLLAGSRISIGAGVFTALLENSVASTYAAYSRAIETSSIGFSELVDLATSSGNSWSEYSLH